MSDVRQFTHKDGFVQGYNLGFRNAVKVILDTLTNSLQGIGNEASAKPIIDSFVKTQWEAIEKALATASGAVAPTEMVAPVESVAAANEAVEPQPAA